MPNLRVRAFHSDIPVLMLARSAVSVRAWCRAHRVLTCEHDVPPVAVTVMSLAVPTR